MIEKFDIHGRILLNLGEATRFLNMAISTSEADKSRYIQARNEAERCVRELNRLPPLPADGERIDSIAQRLGTDRRSVIHKIDRHNRKMDNAKILPLWSDKRGLIYPPDVFARTVIQHRRVKRRKPTARKR